MSKLQKLHWVALVARTGELCVLTPLYPKFVSLELDQVYDFKIYATTGDEEPLGVVVDGGFENCELVNWDIAKKYVEILGEL